jgi:hypothetical protein
MKPNKVYDAIEQLINDGVSPDEIAATANKIYRTKKERLAVARGRLIDDMLDYIYLLCPDQELTDDDIDRLVDEFINFEKILEMVNNK